MKIINSVDVGRGEVEKLLRKKPFDEIELPQKLLDFQALALKFLRDVRIIPQAHKLIKIF